MAAERVRGARGNCECDARVRLSRESETNDRGGGMQNIEGAQLVRID
jgi:hypothetical protein